MAADAQRCLFRLRSILLFNTNTFFLVVCCVVVSPTVAACVAQLLQSWVQRIRELVSVITGDGRQILVRHPYEIPKQ